MNDCLYKKQNKFVRNLRKRLHTTNLWCFFFALTTLILYIIRITELIQARSKMLAVWKKKLVSFSRTPLFYVSTTTSMCWPLATYTNHTTRARRVLIFETYASTYTVCFDFLGFGPVEERRVGWFSYLCVGAYFEKEVRLGANFVRFR